jgi:hypothetical protein
MSVSRPLISGCANLVPARDEIEKAPVRFAAGARLG